MIIFLQKQIILKNMWLVTIHTRNSAMLLGFGILKVHNVQFVQVTVKTASQSFYLKDYIKFTNFKAEIIILSLLFLKAKMIINMLYSVILLFQFHYPNHER